MCEGGWLRGAVEVAGLPTAGDPIGEQLSLRGAQTTLTLEPRVALAGQPRRHEAALRDLDDLRGMVVDVVVVEQREWTGPALVMARRAMGVDERRDVASVGRCGGRRRRLGRRLAACEARCEHAEHAHAREGGHRPRRYTR
jgi:hypothetical protein